MKESLCRVIPQGLFENSVSSSSASATQQRAVLGGSHWTQIRHITRRPWHFHGDQRWRNPADLHGNVILMYIILQSLKNNTGHVQRLHYIAPISSTYELLNADVNIIFASFRNRLSARVESFLYFSESENFLTSH